MKEGAGRPLIVGEVLFDVMPGGTRVLGGAPFNVAWHLEAFGLRPLMITRVGADDSGDDVLTAMESWGMDTSGVQRDDSHPTGRVQVELDDGEPTFYILPDQAYDHFDGNRATQSMAGVEFSLLYHGSLISRGGGSRSALDSLKEGSDIPLFIDVNLRDPWWKRGEVVASVRQARWVKLNETELGLLAGGSDVEAAKAFRGDHGLDAVIVTRGGRGAVVVDGEGIFEAAPPGEVQIVDTVGAGDAFSAVFILGLANGWPTVMTLERALEFAAAVCTVPGATVKDRGFTVGERTFGYRSVPVGEIRMDKKGRPRPEGYRMEIEPREAAVVLRIFQAYGGGMSLTKIVRMLNEEGVPGRFKTRKGWSPGTVGRILDNEKYNGRWVWNKKGTRKDPRTGRRRQFVKPEPEWVIHEDESLRIVPPELWDEVRERRKKVRRSWPGGKGKRGFSREQGSRQQQFPTHLLSGSMVCGECGAAIALVSGKGGGYYGCLAAAKGSCDNKMLVRRRLVEKVITDAVREQISSAEQIRYVLERVEEEVRRLYAHVPETIRLKETEMVAEERRLANFVDFIGEGRGSQALAKALVETERRAGALREELDGLRRSGAKVFQAPPVEWIEERLENLGKVLEQRTGPSALVLRKLLGQIQLVPTRGDIGRPYYVAKTSIDVLAVLDPGAKKNRRDGGSNSSRWWTRTRRIRTTAALPIEVPILEIKQPPVYQQIAPKAQHLQQLGLSQSEIGRRLGIDRWTVGKALRWLPRDRARLVACSDPDDVYYLRARGGETEVRLRSRTPLIDVRPIGEVAPLFELSGFVPGEPLVQQSYANLSWRR